MEAIKQIDLGVQSQPQLYNLEEDPRELNNLATRYPEKVLEMKKILDDIIHNVQ